VAVAPYRAGATSAPPLSTSPSIAANAAARSAAGVEASSATTSAPCRAAASTYSRFLAAATSGFAWRDGSATVTTTLGTRPLPPAMRPSIANQGEAAPSDGSGS
jgi:hypothetical protein